MTEATCKTFSITCWGYLTSYLRAWVKLFSCWHDGCWSSGDMTDVSVTHKMLAVQHIVFLLMVFVCHERAHDMGERCVQAANTLTRGLHERNPRRGSPRGLPPSGAPTRARANRREQPGHARVAPRRARWRERLSRCFFVLYAWSQKSFQDSRKMLNSGKPHGANIASISQDI